MRILALLLLSLAAPIPSVHAEESATIVAVFPIEDATGRLSSVALDGLNEYLASKVGRISGFSIVPASELHARLGQQKVDSYKECIDQSCQIEIGREMSASKVLAARITAVGTSCIVSAYLFDLVRATTDATSTARTGCEEDGLVSGLDQILAEFAQGQKLKQDKRLDLLVGRLSISSTPKGGAIQLDGRETGLVTPALIAEVAAGQHRIVVSTEEAVGEANAEVGAGAESAIEVVLRRRPNRLTIVTDPPGADIVIAGRVVGISPLTTEVAEGPITVEARATNGARGTATVTARPSRVPLQVSIPLLVAPPEDDPGPGVGWTVGWLAGAGALVAGGLVVDFVPSSSKNGRFDGLDVVPLVLYLLGAGAAAAGIVPNF
jgi:hypothetical protein